MIRNITPAKPVPPDKPNEVPPTPPEPPVVGDSFDGRRKPGRPRKDITLTERQILRRYKMLTFDLNDAQEELNYNRQMSVNLGSDGDAKGCKRYLDLFSECCHDYECKMAIRDDWASLYGIVPIEQTKGKNK